MISAQYQPYFVLIIVCLLFWLIYKEYVRASVGFMLAVLLLTITGILTPKEVLTGFSNESIASIVMLILITTGLRKNFQLEMLFDLIFKKAKTYRGFLIRMMSQVALLSTLINNTPVVALMTPYVVDWGKKNRISPSRLLIPLSFATIMGGMITLIGTSTTMVLNGFIQDYHFPSLKIEDLFMVGITVTIAGIIFIALFGHKFLPDHRDVLGTYSENKREYVTETRILPNSKLINKSVKEAGLRNLKGVYLVEILRGERIISPVDPNETLEENDVLFFAGKIDDIVDLINSDKGLELPTTARFYNNDSNEVVEGVLSNYSSLIGKTVKNSDFRNRYNAAIIAIHRNGEKVSGKIGDITFEPGDLLLLYAGDDFRNRVEIYRDLFVISKLRDIVKPGRKKYYAIGVSAICAIILLFSGQFSLFPSLLIILSIMVGFKLITVQDVKRELDINLIVILVFSLAIGVSIIKTGAGELIATKMIDIFRPYGNLSLLIGLALVTNILTTFIVNIGAVSISFPVALSISQHLGIDATPFFLAIAFAASGAFMSPIGYQTNLIVYGPGGYNFKDFFKIGLPVNLIYLCTSLLVIISLYHSVFL